MQMETEKKLSHSVWGGIDVAKDKFDAALYLPVEPGQMPRDIMSLPKKTGLKIKYHAVTGLILKISR